MSYPPNSAQNAPPGYPTYPQGGYAPTPQGAYPLPELPQNQPNGQYPTYSYPYGGHAPQLLPAPKKDTYRLVIGIISTVLLSLTVVLGLLVALIAGISALVKSDDTLSSASLLTFVATFATIGGGVGLYFTIRALMGRPSARVRLPSFWVPLVLTAVVLGVGIAQFDLGLPQASAYLETPLLLLTGILPAIAIFSFTSARLGYPSTWRRVWMSLLSGMFLATTLALILELVASGIISSILRADAGNLTSVDTSNTAQLIAIFLTIAVVAPLVEEGLKPLGPLTIIGRIGSAAEAFLLGMVAGLGFAIFETIGYIGQGGADWIATASERVGAGLLHGVGAGMATLGWYYLTRGKGVNQRYLKGFGAIFYAIVQHAVFNGSTFLALVPGLVGTALSSPVWFFGLPIQGDFYLALVLYAVIIGVLVRVTGNLRTNTTAHIPAPAEASTASVPAAPPLMGGAQ